MRTNYEGRRLPLFPSSPAFGRTKPDGRMDVNGAVRTRERRRERESGPTEEDNERNGAFSEKSAQQRARESTVDRVGKERARGERLGRPNGRQASFSSRIGNLGKTFKPRSKLRYFLGM